MGVYKRQLVYIIKQ